MKLSLGKFCGLTLLGLITLTSLSRCGNEAPATVSSKKIPAVPEYVTQSPAVEETDDTTSPYTYRDINKCTRPFRSRYEEILAVGQVKRPSLVANARIAMQKADEAKNQGNHIEYQMRTLQGLVITEDKEGKEIAKAYYDGMYELLGKPDTFYFLLPTSITPCVK